MVLFYTLVHGADKEHLLKHDGGPVQLLADDGLVHQLAHQDVIGLCFNVVFIYVFRKRPYFDFYWVVFHSKIGSY